MLPTTYFNLHYCCLLLTSFLENGVADETVPEKERLITFANNVKMIANHNKKYEQGLTTYKMGLNVMSDVV